MGPQTMSFRSEAQARRYLQGGRPSEKANEEPPGGVPEGKGQAREDRQNIRSLETETEDPTGMLEMGREGSTRAAGIGERQRPQE